VLDGAVRWRQLANRIETLVGRADMEWHVMRDNSVVEQATAKEITHQDIEIWTVRLLYVRWAVHWRQLANRIES